MIGLLLYKVVNDKCIGTQVEIDWQSVATAGPSVSYSTTDRGMQRQEVLASLDRLRPVDLATKARIDVRSGS